MILQFLSRLFNFKTKKNDSLYAKGEGSNNAKTKTKKEIISNPQKSKAMKKAKPNLPASSMLQAPVAAGKVVKKAAKKAVAKALIKKAAKKK